jgi:hypothetical protein
MWLTTVLHDCAVRPSLVEGGEEKEEDIRQREERTERREERTKRTREETNDRELCQNPPKKSFRSEFFSSLSIASLSYVFQFCCVCGVK